MLVSKVHARGFSTLALVGALALTACSDASPAGPGATGDDDESSALGQSNLALVEDRQVKVVPWSGPDSARVPGETTTIDVVVDGQLHPVIESLRRQCYSDLTNVRKAGELDGIPEGFEACAAVSIPEGTINSLRSGPDIALLYGCMGTYALSIAEATSTYYLGPEFVSATPSPGATHSVPPSTSSDRASWALLAAELYRDSVYAGSVTLAAPECTPTSLRATYTNMESPEPYVVDWAEKIANQLAESLSNSVLASEKAAKYLHASAQARHASESDRSLAQQRSWRDPYDSLLRAASAYVRIPRSLYNVIDDNQIIEADGSFPVVTHVSVTDADRRAEQLIRRLKVDPRVAEGRSLANVANDLIVALNAENEGAFSSWENDGLGYLAANRIAQEDLERAAARIVEENAVLGRPILPDPFSPSNGVTGTQKETTPVNPWYLYAITETALAPDRVVERLGGSYARNGIFHAMDYFLASRANISNKAFSAATQTVLDSANAYARSQVQGHLEVYFAAGTPDRLGTLVLGVRFPNEPFATTSTQTQVMAAYRSTYDVWLGEEGLQCALTGTDRFGGACKQSWHKLEESVTISTLTQLPFFSFSALDSGPMRDGNRFRPFEDDGEPVYPRLYVTRRDAEGRYQLLAGFTVLPPGSSYTGIRIPISTGLTEALHNTLGVDPLNADQTAQLCGSSGLPRNIKVGLEDELLQAQGTNGSNTVEESWSYYLKLADLAADEADLLGTDLVEKGLSMDMLAEDARAELEELCGGTINIGSLREQVCAPPFRCDLAAFLDDPSNASNQDLQQLKRCLGVDATVNAVLGSNAVCTWQVDGQPLPCTCPDDPAGYAACPGRAYDDEDRNSDPPTPRATTRLCPAPLPAGIEPTPAACEALFLQPKENVAPGGENTIFPEAVRFKVFTDTLALLPALAPDAGQPDPSACQLLAAARGGDAEALAVALPAAQEWTQGSLRDVAKRISVSRDHLNFVTIKLNDVSWLKTGKRGPQDDPSPWWNTTKFPCAPMFQEQGLDCAGNPSLLCSSCDAGGSGLDRAVASQRMMVGERFARAAELLRVVTGETWEGIEFAGSTLSDYADMFPNCSFKVDDLGSSTAITGATVWLHSLEHSGCGDEYFYIPKGVRTSCISRIDEDHEFAPDVIGLAPQCTPESGPDQSGETNVVFIDGAEFGQVFHDFWGYRAADREFELGQFWAGEFQFLVGAALLGDSRPLKRADRGGYVGAGTLRRHEDLLSNYSADEMLDALELACIASNPPPEVALDCEDRAMLESANVNGVDDLARARGILECRAQQIHTAVSAMTLQDVPSALAQQLGANAVANIWPTFGGQYAVTVNELYGALQSIAIQMIGVSEQARAAGFSLELVRSQLEGAKYRKRIAVESAAKEIAALHDSCTQAKTQAAFAVAASMSSVSLDPGAVATSAINASSAIVGAQQACSSAKGQEARARALAHLESEVIETEIKSIIIGGADAMLKHQAEVAKTWLVLQTAYGNAQAAIAKLAAQRNAGYRAAAKMLMLDNSGVGQDFRSNTVMRARLNTLRVRYERARDYAIRMTYLARRAIEQKIGMDLSTLSQDVGWVPAPQKWADTICSLEGIDYDKISNAEEQKEDTEGSDKPYDYADQYVGDYVRRLEELMTAYVNSYVSHDGDDVALVSVRDELLGLRATECDAAGQNELLHSYLAMNGGAFGSLPGAVSNPSWETTCDRSGVCATVQAFDDPDLLPFVPAGRNEWGQPVPARLVDSEGHDLPPSEQIAVTDIPTFGALGNIVRPVRLAAARSAGALGGEGAPAPQSPPEQGMVYWYRGDHCGPGLPLVCEDQSGLVGRNTPSAVGEVTLLAAGIGGKPTLAFANGGYLRTPQNLPRRTAFTVTAVIRSGEQTSYLWWDNQSLEDGRSTQTIVSVRPDWWWLSASADLRNGAGPAIALSAAGRHAPQDRLSDGDIITIRADGQSTELFVNGVLRGRSTRPTVPSNLTGYVGYAESGTLHVAEFGAYDHALSDADLDALHAYLAGRYQIDVQKPVGWFNADAYQELRDHRASELTGYRFPEVPFRDAASGRPYVGVTPSLVSKDVVPFAGGHGGLRMDYEEFAFSQVAYSAETIGNQSSRITDAANGEYAATMAVKLDPAGVHRLMALQFSSSTTLYDGYLYLDVDCASSRAQVTNSKLNSSFGTESGDFRCGEATIVTIRGSRSRNTTELFVNGRPAASYPSALPFVDQPFIGGRNDGYMRGLLADAQFFARNVTDDEIARSHAALGWRYGVQVPEVELDSESAPVSAPRTSRPEYRQTVRVTGGTYLLTWYQQNFSLEFAPDAERARVPALPVEVRVNGAVYQPVEEAAIGAGDGLERWLSGYWRREYRRFELPAGELTVAWSPLTDVELIEESAGVLFAAPQLERVHVSEDVWSRIPSAFLPTDDDGFGPFGVCEDRDGAVMRREAWAEGCEVYCPPGLGSDCAQLATDTSKLPKRCFRELKFHISQDEIEKGKLIPQGGFAAGNFNYRWEEVAVNAVGTALKDCEKSELPSACYANNFLQYSLRHDGPFTVRNYLGRDYEAPIYPGRVQQSKALMAERYLTNPLSGADRALLSDFWDQELVGRPLEGNYTLRIYHADGLDWDALEDIQLMIHYRYWTRLN